MTRTALPFLVAALLPSAPAAQIGEPGVVDYTPELPPTATYPIFTDIAGAIPTLGADFDDIGSGRGQLIADLVGRDPLDPTNPFGLGPPDGIPDVYQSNSNSPALPLGALHGEVEVPPIGTIQLPCILLRGEADGSYTNVAPLASPFDPQGYNLEHPGGSPWGVLAFDYDADGFLDLFHANGGFNTNSKNTLNKNLGDGTFRNVSAQAGITEKQQTMAAVALDHDLDGDLDLYVGNAALLTSLYVGDPDPDPVSRLYENQGDGTFVDVAPQAKCDLKGTVFSLASGDLDRNGRPDIYVSCFKQYNKVFYGVEDGTFSFMAPATNPAKAMSLDDLVPSKTHPGTMDFGPLPPAAFQEYPLEPHRSMPLEIVDLNGDRWPDLVVAAWLLQMYDDNPTGAEGAYFAPIDPNRVYLNRGDQDGDGFGDGMFREAAEELGLRHVGGCMCIAVGDYNGDGYPDVYLGGGGPNIPVSNEEDYLYVSEPTAWPADFQQDPDQPLSKAFWEVGALAGTYGNKLMSHGANAFFHDGRLDVVVGNGGPAIFGDGQRNVYWRNTGNADGLPYRMTQVKLEATRSAPGAAGATVELVRDGAGGAHQTMTRTIDGGSRFGCHNALGPVFGLGQGGLLWGGVRWPSGARQGRVLWLLDPKPAELTFVEPDLSLGLDASYPAAGGVDLALTLQELGSQPRVVALTFVTLLPSGGGFTPAAVIPLAAPVVVSPGPALVLHGLIDAPATGLYAMIASDALTGEMLNVAAVWHEPALEGTAAPLLAEPPALPVDSAASNARTSEGRERIVVRAARMRLALTGVPEDAVELTLDGTGERALPSGDLLRWSDGTIELLPAALTLVEQGRADGRVVVITGQVDACCDIAPEGGSTYLEFPSGAEVLEIDGRR